MPVQELIHGLSLSDKQALYEQLGFDLSKPKKAFTRLELDTWVSISEVCHDATMKSMNGFVKNYGRQLYADKCLEIDRFVAGACSTDKIVVLATVRWVCLRELVVWMKKADIDLSVGSLLNCIRYMPSAVNKAFPCYAECRLLDKVAVAAAC